MAAQLLQAAQILDGRVASPTAESDFQVPSVDERRYADHGESSNESELEEDLSSSPTQNAQPRNNKPYKRQGPRDPFAHNSVEKRRRAYLAECYSKLKTVMPSMRQSKISNALVLQGAADYIMALQTEERLLLAEINHQREIKQSLMTKSPYARQYFVPAATEEISDSEGVVPGPTAAAAAAAASDAADSDDGFQTAPGSPITTVEEQPVLGLMLLAELLEGCNPKYQQYSRMPAAFCATPPHALRSQGIPVS